eukprot:g9258.t1
MRLCKEESRRASSTRSASRRTKKVRSARKAAKAPTAATAGAVLEAPTPLAVKTARRGSRRQVDNNMSNTEAGEERLHSSSTRSLEEKNPCVLSPVDPRSSANGAQWRSRVRGGDGPSPSTPTAGSNARSAVPVPLGPGKGKRQHVAGCGREAVFEDVAGGCLEHQKTPAIIRDKESVDDAKGMFTSPDATGGLIGEARAEAEAPSPPQVAPKGRPLSSRTGVGDRLTGPLARTDSDDGILLKRPNTPYEGATADAAAAALSLSNDECAQAFPTQTHHRAAGSWSNPPAAATVESSDAKTGGAGANAPPSSAGDESDRGLTRAEASAAANPSSTTGVLVGSRASLDDGELGSLLSTFERQVQRGAELIRSFEEAAMPTCLALDGDVKGGEGGHGKEESGHSDMVATMSPSSVSSEDNQFTEKSSVATNVAAGAAATETEEPLREPVMIAASPGETDPRGDREPERTGKNSNPKEALLSLAPVPEQPNTHRGESINRSLSALGEQSPSPDTDTSLEEDNENYEFTFDDEEMVVGHKKSVQFADESRWRTHEVRACFEQHELGALFYTTAELDSMMEEAEAEEALERSGAPLSQGGERMGDEPAVVGGSGSGSLLCFGGDQAPPRKASSSGAEEIFSFEHFACDDEDSDYDF